MSAEPTPVGRHEHRLRVVAAVCLVLLAVSIVMIVVGDPIWNLYVIWLGLFVAPPIGVIAGGLLIRSRRRRLPGA